MRQAVSFVHQRQYALPFKLGLKSTYNTTCICFDFPRWTLSFSQPKIVGQTYTIYCWILEIILSFIVQLGSSKLCYLDFYLNQFFLKTFINVILKLIYLKNININGIRIINITAHYEVQSKLMMIASLNNSLNLLVKTFTCSHTFFSLSLNMISGSLIE